MISKLDSRNHSLFVKTAQALSSDERPCFRYRITCVKHPQRQLPDRIYIFDEGGCWMSGLMSFVGK